MEEKKEKKNKGGRPTKTKDKKLDYQIGLRFSMADRVIIKLKADKAGLSMSDYIRQAAKEGKVRRMPTPEEIQLYRDFSGAVNNLNQLVKESHKQNLSMIAPDLLKMMKALNDLIKRFDNQD